jgi:hypothetical protein
MTQLIRGFQAVFGRYFQKWQLTVGLVLLLFELLLSLIVSISGVCGVNVTHINYWMMLVYSWVNGPAIWVAIGSIALLLAIYWIVQFLKNQSDRKTTMEAFWMVFLAFGIATFYGLVQVFSGSYSNVSSLAVDNRQYHLMHRSSFTGSDFLILSCTSDNFSCQAPQLIDPNLSSEIRSGQEKGHADLTYNLGNKTFGVKTSQTLIDTKISL